MSQSLIVTKQMGRQLSKLLIFVIRCYQKVLSPLLGPRCRFYPSCSEYAVGCLQINSLPKALKKILWRLARCHPFHDGGVDLP